MRKNTDAFGHALWDAYREGSGVHVIEREDGYIDAEDAAAYLRPPGKWTVVEHAALRLARGRVLDVGCGAGRHALAPAGAGSARGGGGRVAAGDTDGAGAGAQADAGDGDCGDYGAGREV